MVIRKDADGAEYETVQVGQTMIGAVTVLIEETGDERFTGSLHGATIDAGDGDLVVIVSTGLKARSRRRVLIHELIHAVSITNGLDLSECKVRCLEQGLEQALGGLGLLKDA